MPAFLASVGTLASVSLVTALGYFLYSRRFRDAADATAALGRIRRAFRVGLPVVYVVALFAMIAAGWLDAVDAALGALPAGESVVGGAVTVVVGLTAPAVAVGAGYFGAFPVVRDLREADVSATTVAARLVRYAVGLAALFVVVVLGVGLAGEGLASGAGFAAAIAVLLGSAWAGSPWLVRLLQSTREPTAAERARLDRLCVDAGFDPRAVRILELADAKRAFAFARGLPGRRHLFVSDYLLAELDDESLRAYLALQAGRARAKHLEVRLAVAVGTVLAVLGPLLGVTEVPGVGNGIVALVALLGGLVGLWAGRRLVYRADDYAAARTSCEAVVATVERFADLNDAPMEWGRLIALRRMEPPLDSRIDRLRDRAARE
ncbi:M48 family metalloprotease [Halosimplex litoreum]|uniref:M48 family metalloprotease n=1 Tax=Halosimplex litoreum TaxID=1198301 RepID=A0A7U3WAW9_9EURY|nr:M48 family metalloprotease [Halosimplex litoreum]QPV64764.1 M48 family metalloprotease [Halosimplex litoreum]